MMFTGLPAQTKHRVIPTPEVVYEDEEDSNGGDKAVLDAPPSELHTPWAEHSQATTPSVGGAEATSATAVLSPPADNCGSLASASVPLPSPPPLDSSAHPASRNPPPGCPPHPLFSIEQLGVDRRLLINRKRQLKMYRVWMQGVFRKLALPTFNNESTKLIDET